MTGKRDVMGVKKNGASFRSVPHSKAQMFCYCMRYFENRIQRRTGDRYEKLQGDQKLYITVLGALLFVLLGAL